jgi:predicted PurR-regulated permease PerM
VRTLGIAVGIVILLAALKAAAAIVVPLLLAFTIAVAFQPISERLAKHGAPPVVAAIVTLVCVVGAVAAIGALIVVAASDLAEAAPRYAAQLDSAHTRLMAWLKDNGLEALAPTTETVDPGAQASRLVTEAVFIASGILGNLLNVLFLTVFMQLEADLLKRKLRLILHDGKAVDQTLSAVGEVQRYLRVKFVLSLANGVLLGLWCWIWGVSNPVLWGVMAFALNFVPVIGSLIAAIPPVLFGVLELGWAGALGVASGYVAVNIVVDNVMEPRLMGRAMGLSPLVLMISLLVWGFVLGPVGALLSVPLTVAARIYFDFHPGTRWIALLLAAGTRGYHDLRSVKRGADVIEHHVDGDAGH